MAVAEIAIAAFAAKYLAFRWIGQQANTTASLRGLSAISSQVVWASGTGGTYLRTTDGGIHWQTGQVPGGEDLDFRDAEAFDGNSAYLMSSGDGLRSKLFRTSDGGTHWTLVFTNPDRRGFFDAAKFWDPQHGILLGDPVDGHFALFTTPGAFLDGCPNEDPERQQERGYLLAGVSRREARRGGWRRLPEAGGHQGDYCDDE